MMKLMNSIAMFAIVLASGCAVPGDDPSFSTQKRPVTTYPDGATDGAVPAPIAVQDWDVKASAADKLEALWPDGAQTSQVLYRVGAANSAGEHTYLAFVVNGGAVQHVYSLVIGSSTGSDFKASWNSAFSTRTNTYAPGVAIPHSGGSSGADGGGKTPSPHPNVFISGEWQVRAILAAGDIDESSRAFLEYAE
jgi:hypothetical protein